MAQESQTLNTAARERGIPVAASTRSGRRRLWLDIATTVAGFIAFWQLALVIFEIPSFVVPGPLAVIRQVYEEFDVFLANLGATALVTVLGFVLGSAVGLLLAILIVRFWTVEQSVFPLLVLARTVPTVAIAPLLILLFGFDLTPKLVVVLLMAFFPVTLSAIVGLQSVPTEMISLARSMGAATIQLFFRFSLPSALPNIFGGLKLAMTVSVSGAIIGEFVGSSQGLGYLVQVGIAQQEVRVVYAAIVMVILLGVILFAIVEGAERLAMPWYVAKRALVEGEEEEE